MIHLITQQKRFFTNLIDTQSSLQDCFEYISKLKYISLDTETTGLDAHTNKIISIQLGDFEHQYFIEWDILTKDDIDKLRIIIASKIVIGQGIKFDMKFLMKYNILIHRVWDTYLAEYKIYHGYKDIKCNLEAINDRYIGDSSVKKADRIHISTSITEALVVYGANDIRNLEKIMVLQKQTINKRKMMRAVILEMTFVKVLAYVEYCGMYMDPVKWKDKMLDNAKKLKAANDILTEEVYKEPRLLRYQSTQKTLFDDISDKKVLINWNSAKQVITLFKKVGIKVDIVDDGEEKESVNKKLLVSQKHKSPIVEAYLNFKEAKKDISTYGDKWIKNINPITGRVHTTFKQMMATGRLSSGNKKDGTSNFQNIPNNEVTRRCFTNQYPDTELVNVDFSGMEMVVLVNTSQEPNLIAFYNLKDADMHSYVASKVFKELEGLGLDEIKTNHKEERSLAKQGGFSIVFGGTGFTVARNLNIPLEKGVEFETGYFEAFPELKAFFDTMLELTLTNGYITLDFKTNSQLNILGVDKLKESLKYYSSDNKVFWNTYKEEKKKNSKEFLKLKDQVSKYFKLISKIKRNSQNYIIQGSSASIMKIAMILFYNWLIKEELLFKVLISNAVHDRICRG